MWDVAALDRRVEHTSRAHREEERRASVLDCFPNFELQRPPPAMVCEPESGKSLPAY